MTDLRRTRRVPHDDWVGGINAAVIGAVSRPEQQLTYIPRRASMKLSSGVMSERRTNTLPPPATNLVTGRPVVVLFVIEFVIPMEQYYEFLNSCNQTTS